MTVIALNLLPLGFRFHPTDEELVNHYLKPKITSQRKSEMEVIPEIDVCKYEPWDLPEKSLIRSDDPEWFFFAPKDRKYPKGHRSNRATEAGYWKATGKDRVIRSKSSSATKSNIVGMKKTLVFHRGRAPRGIRTNWIMHEYRITEPEFESGDQGGYVIYRLFRKPEEKSSSFNTDEMETNGSSPTPSKSSPDEMDTNGFSPTPTKSSPGDTQHEADVMDEFETPLIHDTLKSDLQEEPKSSPDSVQKQHAGIKRWLADEADHSTNLPVKAEKSCHNLVSPNKEAKVEEKDALKFSEMEYEQIHSAVFPNISSPVMPNIDYSFISDANQEVQIGNHPVINPGEDTFNACLISALNPDDCTSGASIFPKESLVESLPKHSSWDSASCKDVASRSDIVTESGLPQGSAGFEASDWFCGSSLLPNDSPQMDNSVVYPEMKTQLSTLYENASLLPYDITGPDLYLVDYGTESMQDLFNSMEEFSDQKTVSGSWDNFEGTGIKIRSHQMQQDRLNSDYSLLQQGIAARRIRLQSSIGKVSFGSVRGGSIRREDDEERESTTKAKQELLDSVEESTSEKNTMRNSYDLMETGMELRARRSPDELPQQDKSLTNFIQLYELQLRSVSDSDSSNRNNHDGKAGSTEAREHVGDNISRGGESAPLALLDKLKELSVHDADETRSSSNKYQISKSVLSLRKRLTTDSDNMLKHSPSCRNTRRKHSIVAHMVYLAFSSVLFLFCFGIWRCVSSSGL